MLNVNEIGNIKSLEKKDILEVELDLTGTCNLDCPLCTRNNPNGKHLLKYNERSLSEIIAQLDEYPNLNMCCMAGVISEPTLHKNFVELIEYLVGRNIQIELYSNASIHSTDWWANLATKMGPNDKVFFTICGSTQELHEKYRVNSSLAKTLENHEAFKNACPYKIDYSQHIRFEYNKEDFESKEMKDILSRFSHDCSIDSSPYNERFGMIKDKNSPIRLTDDLSRQYVLLSKLGKKRYKDNKDNKISCQMRCKSLETKFIAIDQFGKVSPCYLYQIYNKDEPFNLNYEDINNYKYDFCYECESMTTSLLEEYGLERTV